MMTRLTALALALALAGAPLAAQTPAPATAVAITGATIYPVSGPKIERGTILLRGGRIVAVGGPDLAVPSDARRLDAAGKVITPGLMHPASALGLILTEGGAQEQTDESSKEGDVDASFNALDAVNPAAITLPIARAQGITKTLTSPTGGLIVGQAVVIALAGDNTDSMALRAPAAMVVDLSENSKAAGGGSRGGVIERLRQILRDAIAYRERRADAQRNQIRPLAAPIPELEALQPVLRGELPLAVVANRRSDIENALRVAREFRLRLVLSGGAEAWQVAPELAAAKVPVIVVPYTDIPSFDGLGARLDNAAILAKAGVPVLISDGVGSWHARNLRFAAGEAVRNGMPWDQALAAITLAPAQAFGLGTSYGTLQPGKAADLVVWSGDPLDFASQAEHVFIGGRDVPLTNRQTELFQRYRTLPPEY
ncbi:MAG TPA: amidohydrolase family protein [Gemmatimonadales bacterium]|nr:amidohydrolase family protein [Gemmatimonadales bacterium]